jgi:hypothetical protein
MHTLAAAYLAGARNAIFSHNAFFPEGSGCVQQMMLLCLMADWQVIMI